MRKTLQASAAAVGALTVALTAGAFASIPGSGTAAATSQGSPPALSSIRPGNPARTAGGQLETPASLANSVRTLQFDNWAGYATYNGTTTFKLVSAHFTVPYLDCNGVTTSQGAWSSHWVGLDGLASGTVEQTGVLAACDGPNPVYAAWWEMFPNFPHYPSITVQPGNAINMSVYYHSTTHQFTMTLSDSTNGQHFSKTVACPSGSTCRRNSAEVISEAPSTQDSSGTFHVLPLADFQAASFTNVHITNTSGTHSGGLRSSGWNTYKITQASDGTNLDLAGNPMSPGIALDRPTPLYRNVTFLDYWMPANAG